MVLAEPRELPNQPNSTGGLVHKGSLGQGPAPLAGSVQMVGCGGCQLDKPTGKVSLG